MTGAELKLIVSENIKYYRKMEKLTQSGLAEKANLSIGYICDREAGHKWGTSETISSIANALNISPYLLFKDNSKSENKTFSKHQVVSFAENLKKQIDSFISRE